MLGLGLDARLGGAPGRAGTAMSSCWAGKPAKHGAIGPLLSLRYVTPDHAIVKMLEREQRKRAAEKRREEERAADEQVKMFELTADGRRRLLEPLVGRALAPRLHAPQAARRRVGQPDARAAAAASLRAAAALRALRRRAHRLVRLLDGSLRRRRFLHLQRAAALRRARRVALAVAAEMR